MAQDYHGALSKMAVDESTIDANSYFLPIVSETLHVVNEHHEMNGVTGTRGRPIETVRAGTRHIMGDIVIRLSPADLDFFLPIILGTDESTDSFALAETLQSFNAAVIKGERLFTYASLVVDTARFVSSPNSFLECTLSCLGSDVTIGAASGFPAISAGTSAASRPYFHHDTNGASGFTYSSSQYRLEYFELTIRNFVEVAFGHSQNPATFTPLDREITLKTRHPYDSTHRVLYDAGTTGAAGSVTFNQGGGYSCAFEFANLAAPPDGEPAIRRVNRTTFECNWHARTDGGASELLITSDGDGSP